MANIISCGKAVALLFPNPAEVKIVVLIPCTILNIANIKSSPYTTTAYAIENLKSNLKACSGFLTSANELHVFITPIKKKITSNAIPCRL